MEILVTGGSGFIGRNIVKILKEKGHNVTTLDLKGKNSDSDRHIVGDIRDKEIVEKAAKGKDYVSILLPQPRLQSSKIFWGRF